MVGGDVGDGDGVPTRGDDGTELPKGADVAPETAPADEPLPAAPLTPNPDELEGAFETEFAGFAVADADAVASPEAGVASLDPTAPAVVACTAFGEANCPTLAAVN